MKILNGLTGHVFVLPLESDVNIIVTQNQKDEMLSCLHQAINAKRKSKDLKLETNDGEPLDLKLTLIYYPYSSTNIETNMNFKAKSEFTMELSEFISQNPDKFLSIEIIRNGIYDLKTDSGIYAFEKILTTGLNYHVLLELNDFNIESILGMLKIDDNQLTLNEKYMMLYNLELYVHRNELKIVYIDFPVDDETIYWIDCQRNDETIFLIDNESINADNLINLLPCNFIKLSPVDFKEEYEIDGRDIQTVSYLFHDYILNNINQQTEKNIRYLNQFRDKNTTFLLIFNDIKYAEVL